MLKGRYYQCYLKFKVVVDVEFCVLAKEKMGYRRRCSCLLYTLGRDEDKEDADSYILAMETSLTQSSNSSMDTPPPLAEAKEPPN